MKAERIMESCFGEVTRMTEAGKIVTRVAPQRFMLAAVCDAYRTLKVGGANGNSSPTLPTCHNDDGPPTS